MLSTNEAQMSKKKCLECCSHSFIFHSYSQLASSSLALWGNLVVLLLKRLWDGVLTDKQFNLMFYKLLQFLILVMAIFISVTLNLFDQRPSTARHFCKQYSAWSLFCVSSLLMSLTTTADKWSSRSYFYHPKKKQTNDIYGQLHALVTLTTFLSLPLCVVAAYWSVI